METRARRFRLASWLALMAGLAFSLPAFPRLPHIDFSTFLGGSGRDEGTAIAAGRDGTSYIAVTTHSNDFLELTGPVLGPPPPEYGTSLYVVALDPQGHRIYSTLVATVGNLYRLIPGGVAVADDGTAYLAYTLAGDPDWFYVHVARLSPTGEVLYRRALPSNSAVRAITVGSDGNVYFVGYAQKGPRPRFYFDGRAAFLYLMTPDGRMPQMQFLDGIGDEEATAVAVVNGKVFVAGFTNSPDLFSHLPSRVKGAYGGGEDAFLFQTEFGENSFISLTYLGGSGNDRAADLAVETDGTVFLAGVTSSADFPLVDPSLPAPGSRPNDFLARLSNAGELVDSTFIGEDWGLLATSTQAIALDPYGGISWMGFIANLPPWDPSPYFCEGTALLRFDQDGLDLLDSACFFTAWARDLQVDRSGNLYLTGLAMDDFNFKPGALQPFFGGVIDAFAARLRFNRPPDCAGAIASPAMIWPPNGKLIPVSVQGVTDPDGDPTGLWLTGIRQDEPLSAWTGFDATGLGTSTVAVRADRAGLGDGRVYHLHFEALDDKGGTCTGTVKVCVPHDQRPGATCGDGGGLFDSTEN